MNREEFLKQKVWAVVGATQKEEKWGYRIYKTLKDAGYEVYGVNPNYDTIDGDTMYHTLSEIPVKVDAIDMVINRKQSISVLEEAKELGLNNIFFQPGSVDKDVIAKAEELGLDYLNGDCIYRAVKESEMR